MSIFLKLYLKKCFSVLIGRILVLISYVGSFKVIESSAKFKTNFKKFEDLKYYLKLIVYLYVI
tara:strand:+ start:257 stop:445 length:189 start_codon:yes stop_codon:yes gene_type:complete